MAWQWKVEVDIESLQQDSERLGRQIIEKKKKNNELKNLINTMRDFWEGDAAEAYINLMNTRYLQSVHLLLTLKKLKIAVDTQVSALKNVDNIFEKLWYQIFVN